MYISQINWGLIFFRNLRITFFKLVGSILNNMEKINTKKEHNQHGLVLKVLIKVTFKLLQIHW